MTAVVEQTSPPSGGQTAVNRPFLGRAVEAFFRRWPYYVVLLAASVFFGISAMGQLGSSYTSNASLFIEPRTLIESQSADEYEGYLARFTGSGFVVQDIQGLIRTDAFMASVAEKAGYEFGESQWERGPLFFELQSTFYVDTVSDHLVWVSSTTGDPDDAQALTQALVDTYTEFQISSATAESLVAEAFFDEVTESLGVELQAAQDATDAYAARLPSLRVLEPEQQVELERLREAEAEAESRFRAAVDGSESARLIRARAETLVGQRFSFVNPPNRPSAPDEAGLAGVLALVGFLLVGLSTALIGPVISAVRVRTVLLPSDLDGEIDVPVLASVPQVTAERLAIDEVPGALGAREDGR